MVPQSGGRGDPEFVSEAMRLGPSECQTNHMTGKKNDHASNENRGRSACANLSLPDEFVADVLKKTNRLTPRHFTAPPLLAQRRRQLAHRHGRQNVLLQQFVEIMALVRTTSATIRQGVQSALVVQVR